MPQTSLMSQRAELATLPRPDAAVEEFRRWLKNQRRRPRTIEAYTHDVELFIRKLGRRATIADITARSIERYVERDEWSEATQGRVLSAIRSFCRFCIKYGWRADDPTLNIVWPRADEPIPRALTRDELDRLHTLLTTPEPDDFRQAWYLRRTKLTCLLMVYAGLRLSEVATLRWADIDLGSAQMIIYGKGGKWRTVPIHRRLRAAFAAVDPSDRGGKRPVIGKIDGTPMTFKSVAHIFERTVQKDFGLDISAHQLRHSFATEMLKENVDIRRIQRLLGHKDMKTTMRYLRVDTSQLASAVEALSEWL